MATRIVIPDTHLWDGVVLLNRGPESLSREIGRGVDARVLPLEIRVRPRDSKREVFGLDVSLADFFLNRKNRDTLNIWKLNFLSDERARTDLRNELKGKSARGLQRALASNLNVEEGVIQFLRGHLEGLGHATDELDEVEKQWKRWLSGEHLGVTVHPWDRPFDIWGALKENPIQPNDLSTFGWKWYQRVRAKAKESPDRASVEPVLEDARDDARGRPMELLEVHTIEVWYSEGRHRALANQHQTNWEYMVRDDVTPIGSARTMVFPRNELSEFFLRNHPGIPEIVESDEVMDDSTDPSIIYRGVTVPSGLREGLSLLDPAEYRALSAWVHKESRGWVDEGDIDSLRRIIDHTFTKIGATEREEFFRKAFYWRAAETGLVSIVDRRAFVLGIVALLTTEKGRQTSQEHQERAVVEYFADRFGMPGPKSD